MNKILFFFSTILIVLVCSFRPTPLKAACNAVTTAAELETCLEAGVHVTLAANINCTGYAINIPIGVSVMLDLNGYNCVWSGSPWTVSLLASLQIKSGLNSCLVLPSVPIPVVGEITAALFNSTGSALYALSLALPVELKSWDADADNGKVKLSFVTAFERDNKQFTIERSADGQTFEPIATLDGAGNSNADQHYGYTDEQPHRGINYYRLVTLGSDGLDSYSSVHSVQVGKVLEPTLSPNPVATSSATVQFEAPTEGEVQITIMNALGQLVKTTTYHADEGTNNLVLDLSELVPSTYLMRLDIGTQSSTVLQWVKL